MRWKFMKPRFPSRRELDEAFFCNAAPEGRVQIESKAIAWAQHVAA